MKKLLIAAIVGIGLGFISAKLIPSWGYANLFVWAAVALALGYYAGAKRQSAYVGGLYGFCLAFTFMLAGYTGSTSVFTKILPFAVLGIFGGLCGLAWSLVGAYAHKKSTK